MKILYDLLCTQPIDGSKFHGGGEYGKAIFERLIKERKYDIQIDVFFNKKVYLDDWLINLINTEKLNVKNIKNEKELNTLLDTEQYSLFYTALPVNYPNLIIPKKTKYIGTIHGLRSIEMPYDKIKNKYDKGIKNNLKNILLSTVLHYDKLRSFYLNRKIKQIENIVCKLDTVITVSEYSKYSMLYYLKNIENDKIKVLYTPQKYVDFNKTEKENKYGNFVLLISADRWIKNAIRAIEALDKLYFEKKLKFKCVIVGKIPHQCFSKVSCPHMFLQIDYASSEILEQLYRDAKLFIYPTLNEGFGMPPLEAMKYNTKVTASAVTSVSEILGDSVLYFNPYDINEIAIKILQSLDSKEYDGITRYKKIFEKQEKDQTKLVDLLLLSD
ncbi:glycosyltransferase [Sporolactobacillus terrae]|uniref:Mannosyltransferase n=1 Tax=Sporolactobacillus terrae TaxID=269673 RepID=A0A5K7WYZ2_9BACL|nr:glycosyltransferase [Sporolactobacillus terrae]BBN97848.1 mannosyltransferase [Sporolactobacillus terrae]